MADDRNKLLHGKFRGSLIGLVVGDATGTTLEFQKPQEGVPPLSDMIGGGCFSLIAGQFTDDSSMALCLAESLIEKQGFDPVDQLARYCLWYREGHLSSNGYCFDIGITTRTAMYQFEKTKEPYPGTTCKTKDRAGNGALMRLCPVPLMFANNPRLALENSVNSSKTTHGAKESLDACAVFAAMILGALNGKSKEELLAPDFYQKFDKEYFEQNPLCNEVETVIKGSYKHKQPPDIKGGGYVVASLEAVLWAFHATTTFKDGLLKVVNLGDDADTTGAIYGQLGGAFYGEEGIPEEWRKRIAWQDIIEVFADELFALSQAKEKTERSKRYLDTQSCYHLIEEGYKPISVRMEPGPKLFKTVKEAQEELAKLKDEYNAKAPDCPMKLRMWDELEHKIHKQRQTKLEQMTSRPKVSMGVLFGKK